MYMRKYVWLTLGTLSEKSIRLSSQSIIHLFRHDPLLYRQVLYTITGANILLFADIGKK